MAISNQTHELLDKNTNIYKFKKILLVSINFLISYEAEK